MVLMGIAAAFVVAVVILAIVIYSQPDTDGEGSKAGQCCTCAYFGENYKRGRSSEQAIGGCRLRKGIKSGTDSCSDYEEN